MRRGVIACCLVFTLLAGVGLSRASHAQARRLYHTTFPFTQIKNGAPLAAIKLNDKIVGHFLFDTGTNPSFISEAMAAKLGVTGKPVLKADGSPDSFAGQEKKVVTLPLVQFGALQFANLPFAVISEQWLRNLLGSDVAPDQPVDGIIGGNFYYSCATLFDFPKHEITIWTAGNLTAEDLKGIHMEDAVPIAIEKEELDTLYDVSARINGRREEKLRIDTASAYTSLSARIVRSLHLKPTAFTEEQTLAQGKVVFGCVTVRQLAIGPFVADNVNAQYSVTEVNGWPPTLGLDILKNTVVLLDAPGKKLYLKPAPATAGK